MQEDGYEVAILRELYLLVQDSLKVTVWLLQRIYLFCVQKR